MGGTKSMATSWQHQGSKRSGRREAAGSARGWEVVKGILITLQSLRAVRPDDVCEQSARRDQLQQSYFSPIDIPCRPRQAYTFRRNRIG